VLLTSVIDLDGRGEEVRWPSVVYGGHEGGNLSERFTAINPVMANIAWRMANEMGCYATVWDFMHGASVRRLFPYVELGDDGSGGSASIKKNIVHLYRRVWGADVAEGSDEVEQALALFLETQSEGRAAVENGEEEAAIPCPIESQPDAPEGTPLEEGALPILEDSDYTLRAWSAVLTYMLSDYNFLFE
jgi:hypothetical protein